MRKLFSTMILVAAAASQMGASDGGCGPDPILKDEGFDMWCGEQLCVWELVTDDGSIEKTPTWHEGDAGVAFVGSEAIIEQRTPFSSSPFGPTCVRFDMVADVPTNAEVSLDIDVHIDGDIEGSVRIPTSNWEPVSLLIKFSRPFYGVRFQLSKRGFGRAVLAQVHAEEEPSSACDSFTPIDVDGSPNGALCNTDDDCESALCRTGERAGLFTSGHTRCVGCDSDHPCSGSQVCGLGETTAPHIDIPQMCVPAGTDVIGEKCITHDECATGICGSTNVCSSCDATHPCASGQCGTAYSVGPSVCWDAPAGAPCAVPENCASLRCGGQWYKQCADARPCETDDQCPFFDGEQGACLTVGISGGICL